MKKVLLAIGNEKFNQLLRIPLSKHFSVIPEELYSLKYLEEFVEDFKPDIIILHDYYLKSEKEEAFDKEVEWLKIIERIRQLYDDQKRIVFICERNQGDPFLSELVNRNVLDIFHTRSIDINKIKEQLLEQPRYSRVAYLKVEGSNIRYKSVGNNLFSFKDITKAEDEQQVLQNNNNSSNEEVKKGIFSLPKFQLPKPKLSLSSIKKESSKVNDEEKVEVEEAVEIKENLVLEIATESEETERKENPEESVGEIRERRFNRKERKRGNKDLKVDANSPEDTKKKKSLFNIFSPGNKEETNIEYSLGTFRPRLIAVGSLHPGAGSTFFIYNFTRYLSDLGIPATVLEALNDVDALFSLAGSEEGPKFDWESVHNVIMNANQHYLYSIPKWNIERTVYIPTLDVPKDKFNAEHAKEILYFARQSPLVFVDISHDWTDPISKQALSMCDELWCITEPNPMYIEVQRKHHQTILQTSNRVGEDNVLVIGNKWGSGVDITRFPEIYANFPYIQENVKAMSNSMPVYRLKEKGFTDFDKLYDRLNESIM